MTVLTAGPHTSALQPPTISPSPPWLLIWTHTALDTTAHIPAFQGNFGHLLLRLNEVITKSSEYPVLLPRGKYRGEV